MISSFIVSLVTFFPLLGIVLLLFVDKEKAQIIKLVGFITSLATFVLSLHLYFHFDSQVAGFQFVQQFVWIGGLNISYHVGIDGLSLLMILLTTFLTPIALLGTWNSIEQRIGEYTMMILLLETGINISPLPVWLDEWEHPEAYSNPSLLKNIANEGVRP